MFLFCIGGMHWLWCLCFYCSVWFTKWIRNSLVLYRWCEGVRVMYCSQCSSLDRCWGDFNPIGGVSSPLLRASSLFIITTVSIQYSYFLSHCQLEILIKDSLTWENRFQTQFKNSNISVIREFAFVSNASLLLLTVYLGISQNMRSIHLITKTENIHKNRNYRKINTAKKFLQFFHLANQLLCSSIVQTIGPQKYLEILSKLTK